MKFLGGKMGKVYVKPEVSCMNFETGKVYATSEEYREHSKRVLEGYRNADKISSFIFPEEGKFETKR